MSVSYSGFSDGFSDLLVASPSLPDSFSVLPNHFSGLSNAPSPLPEETTPVSKPAKIAQELLISGKLLEHQMKTAFLRAGDRNAVR